MDETAEQIAMREIAKMQDAEAKMWRQRRYTIAKAMLPVIAKQNFDVAMRSGRLNDVTEIAKLSVRYADALIAELKKDEDRY